MLDFLVPTNHWVNVKEREPRDNYLDFAWEQRKRLNMKVTLIPIVTVSKGLERSLEEVKIEGPTETIQTTSLYIGEKYQPNY